MRQQIPLTEDPMKEVGLSLRLSDILDEHLDQPDEAIELLERVLAELPLRPGGIQGSHRHDEAAARRETYRRVRAEDLEPFLRAGLAPFLPIDRPES